MKSVGHGRIRFWEGASLWIMEVPTAPGAAAHATDFHAHHAIQITLPLGGRTMLRTNTLELAGDAIVAPDVMHLFEAEGHIAHMFVEPESEAGRAIAKTYLGDAPLAKLPRERISDLINRLSEIDEQALEGIGRALVARLAGVERATQLDPRVRRIIAYASSHLDGPISLPSAAKLAGLSPSRARHLFVEQTGVAFRTYLLWVRIMKAVALFADGCSLTEAAHEAGFADSAHFSRTFRRMFGISAAALRIT